MSTPLLLGVARVPRIEPFLQPADRGIEFLLELAWPRARSTGKCRRHSSGASRSTVTNARQSAASPLCAASKARSRSSMALRFSAFASPQLRLGLEVFAARLVRALSRLMKPLPVRIRVAEDALAHRLPVFLQLMDALRERLRLQ